ncbi:ABC transporter substrate-binding protein [Pseudolabrys taiwanensis]|uniref:ABC transporter substrate-binding protein n=1 Tax=Pseudolabrys taiwanensis TaxID=331696 RepID=UPI001FE05D0E|nr:ABC transporter substrate-binding protein [Pseudolabrys taiwanensis]
MSLVHQLSLLAATTLALAVPVAAQPVPDEARKELAPTGTLRAAINLGNGVLAQKDEKTGEPKGVTPELARALGKRLGVPVQLVVYEAAGKVFDGASKNEWDIAFVAIEPVRASVIEFTAPYVLIEGVYMVPTDSPIKSLADVDKAGNRIAVGLKSAYDLFLTRTIKNATIVRAATGGSRAMIDLFRAEKLEVVAGVRQPLADYAKDHADVRMIDEPFMQIEQAMGTPKGRLKGVAYLRTFIEEMKASGFVADALKRSGQNAAVAPAAK